MAFQPIPASARPAHYSSEVQLYGTSPRPPALSKMDWIERNLRNPHHPRLLRLAVTLVALGAITTFVLFCAGAFNGTLVLPPLNWTYLGIGLGVGAALVTGAALIIHRLRTKPTHGSFAGDTHFQASYLAKLDLQLPDGTYSPSNWEKWNRPESYVDLSCTLSLPNSEGVYHPIWVRKEAGEHEQIAVTVLLLTPLDAATAIIRHLGNALFKPLCTLIGAGYESFQNIPEANRRYHLSTIPKDFAESVWCVVKAPFYMVAMQMSCLYALVDPINGRKLGALIEQEWARGKMLHESIWSAQCVGSFLSPLFWRDLWVKFQRGAGFTVPGCWRPIGYVKLDQDRQISEVKVYHYFSTAGEQADTHFHLFLKPARTLAPPDSQAGAAAS